jgi:TonB-linked SusC/RagA family outer membrane protein
MKSVFVWMLLISVTIISLPVFSQSISGIITDEYEMPIPGVSVYVKGTTIGTVSTFDGLYNLTVPSGEITGDSISLVFSYVGYAPQEYVFPADPDAAYERDIVLAEDVETLEEFVVVGYGVQRASDVTGAVSKIRTEDIANLPVRRIDQALAGRAAGVQVNETTGQPGENVKVRIRGVGTINNNDPLYIIDGVPTKEIGGILNPEDIESMTVLKDAAAAAIYGARAGNGVVIIKTKKGISKQNQISYNGYVGVQTIGNVTPMTNAEEYIEIFNEAAAADGRKLIPESIYPQLANTDHMASIFEPAVMTNHQLNFSGGSENSTYLIGGAYLKQDGIILNSGYERINFRINLTTNLSKKVSIGTNLTFAYSSQDIVGGSGDGFGGNGGSVVRYAFFRTPPLPIYNPDGSFVDLPNFDGYTRADQNTWFGDGYNPVGFATKYDWNAKIYRTFGNVFLKWDIIPNLVFRTDFGVDLSIFDEKRFNENWGTDGRINNPSSLNKGMGSDFTWNWTNSLNWMKTFNEKHSLNILVGTEAIKNNRQEQIGNDRDFPDQSSYLRYLGNGLNINKGATESEVGWSLLSAFGRINYNYSNRYLVEAVVRADGSSRFAEEQRWGVFYSGSLGWNIHNESFMERAGWLNQLKLRLSLGQTGNQEIGLYNYLSIVSPNYNYPFGGVVYNGYVVSSLGNIETTWETTTTYNIGLDLAFLDDRLTVITDYYWRYTTDMLVPVPLPPSGGSADPPFVNAGKVLNQGLEIELFWRELRNQIKYEIGGNISFLQNEVKELGGGRPIAAGRVDNGIFATLTEEGYPIGSFYMYEMIGIFQNELEIFSSPYQGPDIQPGDVRFKDQNGDNVIDENDRTHVGTPIPKILYGLIFNVFWKNFDLSLFLQGASGNSIYMQVNQDIEGFYRGFNVTKRYYDNRWTGEGSTNEYPRASWIGAANNKISSTRFLESGSYLRIKNISLGYNIPVRESSRIKALRVYFSVQNAFTFTNFPGLDPEMYDSDNLNGETVQNPDLASGIDWGTYPVPRIFTLGVNFTF